LQSKEVIQVAKTSNISIRTDAETKRAIEFLYGRFGITVSDAVNIFFRKSLMEGGLPFEMRQPRFNMETENAMREAMAISKGEAPAKTQSVDSFFAEMGL
jgi:DNA-damage-inducible protein J